MNEKEISEIRRRLRPEKNNIAAVHGCYVNMQKEIVSQFTQSMGLMPEKEAEKYLALLKRALSGAVGKNLINLTFQTRQVLEGEEHKLLMQLRETQLKDQALLDQLYQKIISSVTLDCNYLILLAYDTYDVPYRGKDRQKLEDASEEVYSYVLCAVCPVKEAKSTLHYVAEQNAFHDSGTNWVAGSPELGFLFPAFNDRRTDLYQTLYYTHSLELSHEEFADAVFHLKVPKPANEQKKTFEALLGTQLEEECSLKVVQSVHEQLSTMIQAHKESGQEQPLAVSSQQVKQVLQTCGISDVGQAKFGVKFEEEFGEEASPRNLINQNSFEVRTPDVVIHVSPQHSDLIETRTIGGTKYILICAEDSVEVNGVPICFNPEGGEKT